MNVHRVEKIGQMSQIYQQEIVWLKKWYKRRLLCSVDASLDSTRIFDKINKIFVHMKKYNDLIGRL